MRCSKRERRFFMISVIQMVRANFKTEINSYHHLHVGTECYSITFPEEEHFPRVLNDNLEFFISRSQLDKY